MWLLDFSQAVRRSQCWTPGRTIGVGDHKYLPAAGNSFSGRPFHHLLSRAATLRVVLFLPWLFPRSGPRGPLPPACRVIGIRPVRVFHFGELDAHIRRLAWFLHSSIFSSRSGQGGYDCGISVADSTARHSLRITSPGANFRRASARPPFLDA